MSTAGEPGMHGGDRDDGIRDDPVADDLEVLAPPITPRDGLWERVRRRVDGEEAPATDGVTIFDVAVRAALIQRAEGVDWAPTPFPGLRAKVVAMDHGTNRWTLLVQMDPGADFPAHDHADDERLVLLDGDLCFADHRMERGDRVLMGAGTRHGLATSVEGCRLLYEGSRADWAPA